tara:strand:- start:38 stop:208 length:171 start_codon:yes stop_codon:yes gene_type:complete
MLMGKEFTLIKLTDAARIKRCNDNPNIKAMWESIAKKFKDAVYMEYQLIAWDYLCG